jgi:hypothetical protein
MRGTGRSGGDVSKQRRRLDQTLKCEAADGRCVASMTSLNLRKDERAGWPGDRLVQRQEGGETWVHIANPRSRLM